MGDSLEAYRKVAKDRLGEIADSLTEQQVIVLYRELHAIENAFLERASHAPDMFGSDSDHQPDL